MNTDTKNTLITYGTFDMFHIGHLKLIQRLIGMSTRLIIAVSNDAFNEIKGKKTVIPYADRAEIVSNIKGVDLVIPESHWEQKIEDVQKYDVDTFAMGDDWEGKFDFLKEYCKVCYLPRTQGISTTQLKNRLSK